MIERGLRLATQHGAAVVATPLHDTIKSIKPPTDTASPTDGVAVQHTIDRSTLRAAQTPQTFVWNLLKRAQAAQSDTDTVTDAITDDAMLIEALGEPVILYDTGTPNPKVTTPDDLVIIEALLQARSAAAAADH